MSEERAGLPVIGFADMADFEDWLAGQPPGARGVWLKFAKAGSGVTSITRKQAIEAALCHGWIDGQSDKYDDAFWLIRFTPRRARSKWSQVNRDTALALIANGRMRPAGLAQIEAVRADGRWDAAYPPQSRAEIPADLEAALAASVEAKRAFEGLDAVNRYAVLHRIHDAKKPETRVARIARFVSMLERGETIYPRKTS